MLGLARTFAWDRFLHNEVLVALTNDYTFYNFTKWVESEPHSLNHHVRHFYDTNKLCMCISRTNARARENELSFSTTIKTLKIPFHTNPSDFKSNFKPQYHRHLGIY